MNRTLGYSVFVFGLFLAASFASKPSGVDESTKPQPIERLQGWASRASIPFFVGLTAMIGGALLVRRRVAGKSATDGDTAASASSPDALLEQIATALAGAKSVGALSEASYDKIHQGLDQILEEHVPAFLEHREALIESMGLAAFAMMISDFATMERAVARAWSANTDHVWGEIAPCLDKAETALSAARTKLAA